MNVRRLLKKTMIFLHKEEYCITRIPEEKQCNFAVVPPLFVKSFYRRPNT